MRSVFLITGAVAAIGASLACSSSSDSDDGDPGDGTSSSGGIMLTTTGGQGLNGGSGGSSDGTTASTRTSGGGGDGSGTANTAAGGASTDGDTGSGTRGDGGSPSFPEPPACPSPTCRAGDTELSCCAREAVPGGSFAMGRSQSGGDACPDAQSCPSAETPEHDATVSGFSMDVFEVTVGRFRQFVEAFDDLEFAPGAGAHPSIANSGWRSAWNAELPDDSSAFEELLSCDADASYTAEAGDNDTLPINCVTWFEAFAFCIYAGGRLATEAEWEYAAAGGDEERLYPWGDSEPSMSTARFYPQDLDAVGSAFEGASRWGQHDLAGNVWEWVLDWLDTGWYSGAGNPCSDCANVGEGSYRALRGGAYSFEAVTLRAATRSADMPDVREPFIGVRCAYDREN